MYPEANVLDLHEATQLRSSPHAWLLWGQSGTSIVLAPEHEFVSPADETLIQEQERGVLLVFKLIKALLARVTGATSWIGLWSPPWRRPSTPRPHQPGPCCSAWAGRQHGQRVSALAHPPDRPGKHRGLGSGQVDPTPIIQQMFRLPPDSAGNAWAYRGGEWLCQELIPVRDLAADGQVYRQNGVYVVIGGAGGLGSHLEPVHD